MKTLTANCIKWIKDYFAATNQTKAVIGISGGKDSTVVAALCAAALGHENVYGIMMPNGEQLDIADSEKVIDFLHIHGVVINIKDSVDGILNKIENPSYDTITNLPARIRMATVYAYAQTVGGMVANTCNLSEDTVGYATLFGDSAGSFAPLARLTTDEVMEIGDDLGLPTELVHKTPIDGLQPKTDEEKLGFTYREVNEIIREGKHGPNYEKIRQMYFANKFKTDIIRIPAFDPGYENWINNSNVKLV